MEPDELVALFDCPDVCKVSLPLASPINHVVVVFTADFYCNTSVIFLKVKLDRADICTSELHQVGQIFAIAFNLADWLKGFYNVIFATKMSLYP